jgi:hypothetical protein
VVAQTLIRGARDYQDRLAHADLSSEELRAQIRDTLTMYLEDDGETVAPQLASFTAFLSFLENHKDRAAPSIGVNRDGVVVAVWREPGFRLTYEFETNGDIHSFLTEGSDGVHRARDLGRSSAQKVPRLPPKQRAAA